MDGSKDHVPVYRRLTDFYSRMIQLQEIRPGGRIDSINKIMNRHRVSRETAKLVLKNLVESGLVVSVQGKGTFVNFPREVYKAWGVMIPFFSSNVEQLISELIKVAEMAGCRLDYFLHYNNPEEEIRITGNLIRSGYEAVIVIPNYDESKTAEYYRKVLTGRSCVILADNTMAGSFFNYVIQSYDLGVKRVFEHLCQRGDGNFLLLGNEIWKGRNMVFDLMKRTFQMLVQSRCPERTLFIISGLREADAAFISTNRISGVLTMQDVDAVRLIGRMKEWGIAVPGQVSVVSYGNTELTKYFEPRITAVDCNYELMAREISGIISAGGEKDKKQVVISPDLILRET
jgi:DNA-binding LacI/PurR family transcriptional regulator